MRQFIYLFICGSMIALIVMTETVSFLGVTIRYIEVSSGVGNFAESIGFQVQHNFGNRAIVEITSGVHAAFYVIAIISGLLFLYNRLPAKRNN